MALQTIPCKHCGKPTSMLGTKQCDGCWEERRSGRMDALEAALQKTARIMRWPETTTEAEMEEVYGAAQVLLGPQASDGVEHV